jgi:hypothetical protein
MEIQVGNEESEKEEIQLSLIEDDISVKWVVKTDEFKTFEFRTKVDVYIEESDMEYDLFRLFIWNEDHPTKSGDVEILVANREDYDIHEDVTHLFDVDVIEAACIAAEPDITDMTAEYIQHYEERRERGEDV